MCYSNFAKNILTIAGKIALRHFRNSRRLQKADNSPVSYADWEIQAYLNQQILTRYPHDGIIAEELGLRKTPEKGSRIWIIDPIDGTDSFLRGHCSWGISLAVVENGMPIAGYFYMPLCRDMYSVGPIESVLLNGIPVRMKKPAKLNRNTLILAPSRMQLQSQLIPGIFPGKIRSFGSTVTHLCYLATGSAEAVYIHKAGIWDLAVGYAMLQKQGGIFYSLSGHSYEFHEWIEESRPIEPMLVGQPYMIDQLQSALKTGPLVHS